jgi:rhodanese-related sulfurtransferase
VSSVARVGPEEARRLCEEEGYVYLDVRTEAEYAAGHPKGAQNVPFLLATADGAKPNARFLDDVSALYAKDRPILVGCRSGARSLKAAEAMIAAGFARIVELRPGYEGTRSPFGELKERGWVAHGLPTETTTPGGSYAELSAALARR